MQQEVPAWRILRETWTASNGGKVAADIFSVLFLGSLASACAGVLIGVTATILVTLGLLVIDYFVPDADDPPGAVVR